MTGVTNLSSVELQEQADLFASLANGSQATKTTFRDLAHVWNTPGDNASGGGELPQIDGKNVTVDTVGSTIGEWKGGGKEKFLKSNYLFHIRLELIDFFPLRFALLLLR